MDSADAPAGASGDDDGGTSESERWRSTFVPRVQTWAKGRGVIALLASLEANYPHTFGLVVPEDKDQARPWVVSAADTSERAVGLAFRRASRHLHPDRLSKRDVSVRIEAEEVLKALGAAFDDVATWHEGGSTGAAGWPQTSPSPSDGVGASGADLRNNIFEGMAGGAAAHKEGRSTSTADAQQAAAGMASAAAASGGQAGGTNLRDAMFSEFAAPAPPPPPVRSAAAAAAAAAAAPPPQPPAKGTSFFGPFGRVKKKDKDKDKDRDKPAGQSKAKENADNPFGPAAAHHAGGGDGPRSRSATPFDEPARPVLHSGVSSASLSAADALFSAKLEAEDEDGGGGGGGGGGGAGGHGRVGSTVAAEAAAAGLFGTGSSARAATVPDLSDLFPAAASTSASQPASCRGVRSQKMNTVL